MAAKRQRYGAGDAFVVPLPSTGQGLVIVSQSVGHMGRGSPLVFVFAHFEDDLSLMRSTGAFLVTHVIDRPIVRQEWPLAGHVQGAEDWDIPPWVVGGANRVGAVFSEVDLIGEMLRQLGRDADADDLFLRNPLKPIANVLQLDEIAEAFDSVVDLVGCRKALQDALAKPKVDAEISSSVIASAAMLASACGRRVRGLPTKAKSRAKRFPVDQIRDDDLLAAGRALARVLSDDSDAFARYAEADDLYLRQLRELATALGYASLGGDGQ